MSELDTIRAQIAGAHRLVMEGNYSGAAQGFARALVPLKEHLGAEHPEVEELVEDLKAVVEMGGLVGAWEGLTGAAAPKKGPGLSH